jgi:hypothetical protein
MTHNEKQQNSLTNCWSAKTHKALRAQLGYYSFINFFSPLAAVCFSFESATPQMLLRTVESNLT